MKLSEHLSLKEVTYSATAIKHGINNEPVIGQLEVLKEMACTVFEPCRKFCGGPLKVTSGYRGPELNKRIGGALSSDHCINDHATAALDLDCDVYKNSTNADLFYYIMDNLPFKQLIWEFGDEDQPNWVHVSWSKNMYLNKREVLVAKRVNGRAVYEYWKKK
jgi:hypothetical protein